MSFNAIMLKSIINELNNLNGYKVDKVNQPNKNTIILGLYGKSKNLNLLSCISSDNFRFHLTKNSIKNPSQAPSFCMLLRKHLIGYKIKNIYSTDFERIVFIEFQNSDNPHKPILKNLIVELMGKHSNIILTDSNNIIIDSLRHTTIENGAQRDIYATSRYIKPKPNSFGAAKNLIDFYNNFEPEIIKILKNNSNNDISNSSIQDIYNVINQILINNKFKINIIENDYLLTPIEESIKQNIQDNESKTDDMLKHYTTEKYFINYSLDNYYFEKENTELFINYRNNILSLILSTLKKYKKRLINIDNKLSECKDMDKYKLYGELITANLYKIPNKNMNSIEVENYYDNCSLIKIPLDNKYYPSINAKRYFKKYSKLKNALEIVTVQKKETLDDINYIESVVYELDSAMTIDDLQDIFEEISENDIFKTVLSKKSDNKKNKVKKSKFMTKNKFAKFNPLKYTIDGYTIYVGRNNTENDILTTKFAKYNDLWFHTKDIHGSHVILKVSPGEKIPEEIILEAARLAAKHSKAKLSSNVPVDYCFISNVKKPNGSKPGMVIYKNNKTIIV